MAVMAQVTSLSTGHAAELQQVGRFMLSEIIMGDGITQIVHPDVSDLCCAFHTPETHLNTQQFA